MSTPQSSQPSPSTALVLVRRRPRKMHELFSRPYSWVQGTMCAPDSCGKEPPPHVVCVPNTPTPIERKKYVDANPTRLHDNDVPQDGFCFCLSGGLEYIYGPVYASDYDRYLGSDYPFEHEADLVRARLRAELRFGYGMEIITYNDYPGRTRQEIYELCLELNI